MKFKYPKRIQVGSCNFKMIYDKSLSDGEFSYADKDNESFIRLGTGLSKTEPMRFLACLIHELKEIIHVEQHTRYRRADNNSYEFHYTHKEHTHMCGELSRLLNLFIV